VTTSRDQHRIRDLLAKQELAELCAAYSRAVDRLDEAALVDLFHADAVIDTFPLLFRREVPGRLTTAATGESLAHLNYLRALGEIRRERDEQCVD